MRDDGKSSDLKREKMPPHSVRTRAVVVGQRHDFFLLKTLINLFAFR